MRKSRFAEAQMIRVLHEHEHEAGAKIALEKDLPGNSGDPGAPADAAAGADTNERALEHGLRELASDVRVGQFLAR